MYEVDARSIASSSFSSIVPPSNTAPPISLSSSSLLSAAAFSFDYLESKSSKTFTVRTFCESIFNNPRVVSAKIVSVTRYVHRSGVPHRFLIFHTARDDGAEFYLRLDRRRDHDVPISAFALRDLGTSNALDTVS